MGHEPVVMLGKRCIDKKEVLKFLQILDPSRLPTEQSTFCNIIINGAEYLFYCNYYDYGDTIDHNIVGYDILEDCWDEVLDLDLLKKKAEELNKLIPQVDLQLFISIKYT